MKRLLLPLLAALALPTAVEANWFGKYGSFKEAEKACDEWVKKKEWVTTEVYDEALGESGSVNHVLPFRECIHEEITREILGFEFVNLNKIYSYEKWISINPYKKKVRKRFEYYKNIHKADDSDLRGIYNQEKNKKNSRYSFCKRIFKRAQFGYRAYPNNYRLLVNSEGSVYYVLMFDSIRGCDVNFEGVVGKRTMWSSCRAKEPQGENQRGWEIKGENLVEFYRVRSCEGKWSPVEKFTYYQLD